MHRFIVCMPIISKIRQVMFEWHVRNLVLVRLDRFFIEEGIIRYPGLIFFGKIIR